MPPPVPTTPGGSPAGIATTLRDAPVVAATTYRSWESWVMTLPKITWRGGMDGKGPDKDWKVDGK